MYPQFLSAVLQHRRGLQTVASVVLVTFTWLLVYPTALAARAPAHRPIPAPPSASSDEAEMAETLTQIEARLAQLQAKLARVEAGDLEADDLRKLSHRLDRLDARVRKTFEQIAQHLKARGLPAEVLDRHQTMVVTYDAELATLRQHLEALAAASTGATRAETAARALTHLREKQPKRTKPRVDPIRLPFHVPDGKVRPPKESREEFDSSRWTLQPVLVAVAEPFPGLLTAQAVTRPAPPTAEDLAPTEDVPLTEEIKALAASLDNDPVKLFTWVRDQIAFLPTYGSLQGAHLTLQTKRGNAFDTASLLIALLRAAGIHARYVYGTVQLPIDKVMNWVGGVTVPEAALQVLGQGGIPSVGLVQGGAITAVKLEHVWVEAWVDYEPSRGAVHRQGDTWIPLDASFKQYRFTPGMDIKPEMFLNAQDLLSQIRQDALTNEQEGWVQNLNNANTQAGYEAFRRQVESFLYAQKARPTLNDIVGAATIIPELRSTLPGSLPYQTIVIGGRFHILPKNMRHNLSLSLYASQVDASLDNAQLSFTISFPLLHTQRLGVTYVAASSTDQALLDTWRARGERTLPAYLLRVKPAIQVEGHTVQMGGTVGLGHEQIWQLTLTGPNPSDHYQRIFSVTAGDEIVFGINPNGMTEDLIHKRFTAFPQETAAENLQKIALYYWLEADLFNELAAKVSRIKVQRLPSVGLFTAPLTVKYLFSIPREAYYASRLIDIARSHVAAAHTSDQNALKDFRAYIGLQGSYLEGAVFDQLLLRPQGTGVSAVQLLQDANNQGIRIYVVHADNVHRVLPNLAIDQDVQADIMNAVHAGKRAIVSERPPLHGNWRGLGYIIQDPLTGDGAYLISGGFNGGRDVPCEHVPQPEPVHDPIVELDILPTLFSILIVSLIVVALWPAAGPAVATAILAGVFLLFETPQATAASGSTGGASGPLAGVIPPPPGDCTVVEHRQLQDTANQVCKESNLVSCKGVGCFTARTLKAGWLACYTARVVVAERCFRGGDQGHQIAIAQAVKNVCNCANVIVEVCP